jgi:hypothetical protein
MRIKQIYDKENAKKLWPTESRTSRGTESFWWHHDTQEYEWSALFLLLHEHVQWSAGGDYMRSAALQAAAVTAWLFVTFFHCLHLLVLLLGGESTALPVRQAVTTDSVLDILSQNRKNIFVYIWF